MPWKREIWRNDVTDTENSKTHSLSILICFETEAHCCLRPSNRSLHLQKLFLARFLIFLAFANISHQNLSQQTKKIISKNSMKNEIYFWHKKLTWFPPASKNLECSSLSKGHKNSAIFGVLILWKLLFFSREFMLRCWYGKLPYDFTSPLFNGRGRNGWWTQNKNQNGNQPRTGLN